MYIIASMIWLLSLIMLGVAINTSDLLIKEWNARDKFGILVRGFQTILSLVAANLIFYVALQLAKI